MRALRQYILPLLLLLLISAGTAAFVYKKVYWVPELRWQGPMLYNLLEYQWHNDVLYMGESSNIWTAEDDADKRNISDMVNDSLQGFRLSGLQSAAYHAGMFLPIVDRIDTQSRVKHLVLTVNLRAFGKPWIYSGQEARLQRIKCFYGPYHPLINRLQAVFGAYPQPTEAEQEKRMLQAFAEDTLKPPFALPYKTVKDWCAIEKFPLPGGGEDFPKRELADHYIKAYAFQIDTASNPRIHDLDRIAEICRNKGIKLYYHLLAENMEWADSLVGPGLCGLMRANRDLIRARYSRKGVVVIDNLERVPGRLFGELGWTTEHYRAEGRMILARQVRDSLQKYMGVKPGIR